LISDTDILRLYEQHGRNAARAAQAAGIARATFHDRLRRAQSIEQGSITPKVPDRRLTALEDECKTLRAALRTAHRELEEAEGLAALRKSFLDAPANPPEWTTAPPPRRKGTPSPEVPIVGIADWHLGETVNAAEVGGVNAYNLDVAADRVHRLADGVIKLCTRHHTGNYPGIVACLLGDFVSGGLHPELLKTDEEEVLPAALRARDLLVGLLRRFAGQFGRVYVPGVAGNHGRHTAKPEFKRYLFKNFDWLIYELLKREFAGDKRIQFDVRPSNDVHFRVFGQRYLALHGDMLGVKGGDGIIGSIGPIMRGEVKKSGQTASMGLQFDKLIMGHWHQRLWLPRAIVAGTLKGFDEYARLQLGAKPDRPTQPLWFVHPSHGMTAHWDVYVDDPPAPSREWVAWQQTERAA
jgi:hypothetical protein